jgi:2-polyprenyl-3-methyl-5-hydroxy-6-metoxy-1,4-benzoquinol methylase
MPTQSVCRVCGGRLELLQRGSISRYEPAAFRPSYHRAGTYGDLYRCTSCATVHQLSLPRGAALHDLYRAMSDDVYLREEQGRRRMARRLLDVLGGRVPRGRLLQVGCGYGLLLDEARQRGYEVEGVDLSAAAVRYAREQLALPVRELALEDAALQAAAAGARYEAIVAVDVLEHLDDPMQALQRLRILLAPGGALLITTPDPASPASRLTGLRWWGYEPAHAYLIPRRTLRWMIREQGLVPVEHTTATQSFTLGYWLGCLSQRGEGRVARAIGYLAQTRLSREVMLTASLRDEQVLLAASPPEPSPPEASPPYSREPALPCSGR